MHSARATRFRSVALALLVMALAAFLGGGTARADEATRYKIRNRWLSDRFLSDSHESVAYGTGGGGGGEIYLWTLEDAGSRRRIRNVGTGGYLVVSEGSGAVTTTKVAPTTPAGEWQVEVGVFPWRSIQNGATGKYLHCERKLGHVECDGSNLPSGDNARPDARLRRRLRRPPFDLRNRSESDLLRPQAAGRASGFQHDPLHQP